MASPRLSVGQAADKLDVSAATVRRYTDRYSSHLSPYANDRPRTYTDQDIARLSAAIRLASQQEDQDHIEDTIADLQAGDIETTETATLIRGDQLPQLPTVTVPYVESLVYRTVQAELDRRQLVQNSMITGVLIGLILALVFTAILLWIVGV